MCRYIKIFLFTVFWLAVSCSKPVVEEDSPINAKVSVEVTEIDSGIISDELTLFANTMYLKRNVVTSPIPAFITRVNVQLGESVQKGQLLYILETKERRALGSQIELSDTLNSAFGIINVKAPASGIINTLDKQQIGDYVLEGSQLCTIAGRRALAFAVNVPYEFTGFTKTGAKCILVLPDDSHHSATFTTPLTTMNNQAQTQTILARSDEQLSLPENLIVKVIVNRSSDVKKQILPKAAILSDEMMKNFWVMKLINDSTAIKVDISPGHTDNESVEIIEPDFKDHDKFLVTGNYGLPDTAFVRIIH